MKHEIELKKDKDCRGSVRYATTEPTAVVSNVYLSRTAAKLMPEKIKVTIEALGN